MEKPRYEHCELKETTVSTGFLGLGFGDAQPSTFVAHQSGVVIYKSRPFIVRAAAATDTPEAQAEIREQVRRHREAAYQEVLQRLTADGWMPVATDVDGRVVSLRRPLQLPANLEALLAQLESLRQAGLLTQHEYEAKKATILGRNSS